MKSPNDNKNNKNFDKDIEEFEDLDEDDDLQDIDVDDSGPKIASVKNNKVVLIVVSSVLVTVVVYLFFIRDNSPKQVVLEEVVPERVNNVQPSEKSPFEFDNVEEKEDDNFAQDDDSSLVEEEVEVVKKPKAPDLPDLPSLPEDLVLPNQIFGEEEIGQVAQPGLPGNNAPIGDLPDLVVPGQNPNQVGGAPYGSANNNVNTNNLDPRYSDIIVFNAPSDAGSPTRSVGYDNNIISLNEDPINALEKSPTSVAPTHIADLSQTIAQGKLLTAVIETAINTEVPGFVRGIVSRDVYAEAGNEVLIPRGSRLFGSYSSEINQGQGRVEISWTRLIRPDGVDVSVSFNASDQFGRAGIAGDVDNKYGSIIMSSLLTSVLAVGGAAAAEAVLNNDEVTTTTDPSNGTTTTTGSATNQVISDVSGTIVDTIGELITNRINTNPVIRIPQGTRITVIVNADLVLPPVKRF